MRGSWAGLLVAVGFTALANVLLATLVFSEWLTLETRLFGYGSLAVVWLLARWQSRNERRANLASDALASAGEVENELQEELAEQPPAERDRLFREAQGHYLSNDWVATEQVLLKLLKQDARDVESRLMLATLWRHQGRGVEALRQLDRLQRLEAASTWQHEIAAERMAIEQTNENPVEDNLSDAPPDHNEAEATENSDRHKAA